MEKDTILLMEAYQSLKLATWRANIWIFLRFTTKRSSNKDYTQGGFWKLPSNIYLEASTAIDDHPNCKCSSNRLYGRIILQKVK